VTVIVSASIKDFILSDTVVFFRGMGNSDNDIIDGGWFTATHKDLTVKKTQRKDIVITV
jgi:ABC-type proline/glycine betaine transport system substrate-binding protein